MRRRTLALVAAAALVLAAAVVVAHDSRRRVVARGWVGATPWTLTAWRGTELCLELAYDGRVVGRGCGLGEEDPVGRATFGGDPVVFGPAPGDAWGAVVVGSPAPVPVKTHALTWLPRRRVFVALLPQGFVYTGVRFER